MRPRLKILLLNRRNDEVESREKDGEKKNYKEKKEGREN